MKSHPGIWCILTDVLGIIVVQLLELLAEIGLLIGHLNIVLEITVIGQHGEETILADVELDIQCQ